MQFNSSPVIPAIGFNTFVPVPDGQGGLIYQIEAAAVTAQDDGAVRNQLLQIIEPISGEVSIAKIEPVRDGSGRLLRYKVWVARE